MSVPAGSSRSPAEEALNVDMLIADCERLAGVLSMEPTPFQLEQAVNFLVATVPHALRSVRAELERLTEGMENGDRLLSQAGRQMERLTVENERLNRYIDQYILDVERLTEERDEAPRSCDLAWEQLKLAQRGFRGRDAAEAEVTRLTAELQHTREGLREIMDVRWLNDDGSPTLRETVRGEIRSIARRALLAGSSVARMEGEQT